ncbi:methionine--tRNA ligase mes1 [Entomophthora muscae]|uniref:Methionine--tRNA ligase mes1 n=1 Tax=Entomophthora muscae TaxID=34485 RepID=A0ACC2UQ76_9FUNG|nr:methionine--tRNA ligase mes1 [Entomophthora muscae]
MGRKYNASFDLEKYPNCFPLQRLFICPESFVEKSQPTKEKFFEISLFVDLYTLVQNTPNALSAHSSLESWFNEFSKKEAVIDSLALIQKLSAGILPQAPSEEAVESQALVGDETMRKIKPGVALPPKPTEPKMPIPGQENILITSALPYVNNVPHLGNLIGSTLSADVFARYLRATNVNHVFICGTDEYGTATETKALEEGVSCQELCDKYNALHKEVYDYFQIEFDHFGRTTTPQQTEIAQSIFHQLLANDCLIEDTMTQLYCDKCSRFLADRYVEGICPKCGYNDARGDQCDQCGGLLNACDLIKPRCKMDGNSPVLKDSTHLFLDLPKLQPACEAFVAKSSEEGKWTANGRTITHSWLKEGLKPRCITRDLKWGTPVPLERMKEKVFYVWYDAPIGYLSITANYTKDWERWWKNPEQVKLYQFMGKDNVPFHTVIFPCSLLGTNDKWTLLHHINTTEYLNYEDGKFSKSRNVGVFGNNVMDTGIPISVWRYYLVSSRPDSNDSIFTWKEFIAKNNSELLANFGNFCNRILKFCASHRYNSTLPTFSTDGANEAKLIQDVNALLVRYHTDMKLGKLRQGLRTVMEVSQLGNGYLQSVKIDNTLYSQHRELCDAAVGVAVNLVYLLSALVFPFMPSTTTDLCAQLNAPLLTLGSEFDPNSLLPGHVIGSPQHLFTRIDEKMEHVYRARYG